MFHTSVFHWKCNVCGIKVHCCPVYFTIVGPSIFSAAPQQTLTPCFAAIAHEIWTIYCISPAWSRGDTLVLFRYRLVECRTSFSGVGNYFPSSFDIVPSWHCVKYRMNMEIHTSWVLVEFCGICILQQLVHAVCHILPNQHPIRLQNIYVWTSWAWPIFDTSIHVGDMILIQIMSTIHISSIQNWGGGKHRWAANLEEYVEWETVIVENVYGLCGDCPGG